LNHNTGRLSALQQVGGGPGHGFFESTQKQAKHVARLKTILTLLNAATHAGQGQTGRTLRGLGR
jgi:hypothetical protein